VGLGNVGGGEADGWIINLALDNRRALGRNRRASICKNLSKNWTQRLVGDFYGDRTTQYHRTVDARIYPLACARPRIRAYKPDLIMPKKTYTWEIFWTQGQTLIVVGTVEAPDRQSAIHKAIKELDIPPNEQNRLVAVRFERQREET